MFDIAQILDTAPFSLEKSEKTALYDHAVKDLSLFHYEHCAPYKKICDALNEPSPFLPVRLFKEYDLLSVPMDEIAKTMTSSGTTGQSVSKIYLDRKNAADQTHVLAKITSNFLGSKRLPMLVIDSRSVLKDRNMFSARGSGILGFSMLGRDVTYALDENMELDIPVIEAFLEKHTDEDIFLFGFTAMIWEHFYKKLKDIGKRLPIDRGIMIHGGGWKKLIEQAVDNDTYKACLDEVAGIKRVYNYYGMVEQTGSIYMECECGRLHTSIFSDIIIRDSKDFSICEIGKKGLIQTISLLPTSYPGHSLLTEDEGELTGEDDCQCGRLGKTFKIHGRIKSAEVRGCSDTYEKK